MWLLRPNLKPYCKTILKSHGLVSKHHNLPKGTLAPWRKGQFQIFFFFFQFQILSKKCARWTCNIFHTRKQGRYERVVSKTQKLKLAIQPKLIRNVKIYRIIMILQNNWVPLEDARELIHSENWQIKGKSQAFNLHKVQRFELRNKEKIIACHHFVKP